MTDRRVAHGVAWLVGLAGSLVALRWLGTGSLAPPPTTSLDAAADWIETQGAVTAAMSLVRLGTEVVVWYLLAVTVVVAAGRATRWALAARLASVLAAPLPDRLVRAALGVSLLTVVTPRPGPATVTDDGAASEIAGGGPVDVATGGPVVVDPATHDGDTARATPWPESVPAGPSDLPAPTPAVDAPSTWTVTSGESLWTIAEDVVSTGLGRPAGDDEIVPFWLELIDVNRHRLVDPDDADLIVPGQVLDLPATRVA